MPSRHLRAPHAPGRQTLRNRSRAVPARRQARHARRRVQVVNRAFQRVVHDLNAPLAELFRLGEFNRRLGQEWLDVVEAAGVALDDPDARVAFWDWAGGEGN